MNEFLGEPIEKLRYKQIIGLLRVIKLRFLMWVTFLYKGAVWI